MNILFPLFAAVVTFWLGVAVESKRGDQLKETADAANQSRATAESSKSAAKATAAAWLAYARGRLESLPKDKRFQIPGISEAEKAGADIFQDLIDKLKDAQKKVEDA